MARLLIFDETVRGIDLPERTVIIGRSRKVDIPIHDGLLSRKHCGIVPIGSRYRLVDLNSQNGTFVNGSRVRRRDLLLDDIIEIGSTVIVFFAADPRLRTSDLARLRNSKKARQLIERISKPPAVENAGTSSPGIETASAGEALPPISDTEGPGHIEELVVDHVTRVVVSRLIDSTVPWDRLAERAIAKVLSEEMPTHDLESVRSRVECVVRGLIEEESGPSREDEAGTGDDGSADPRLARSVSENPPASDSAERAAGAAGGQRSES